MTSTTEVNNRRRLVAGLILAVTGLAHFVFPATFEPLTRLAFPERPRQYGYLNGGIETAIGLTMISPATRKVFRGLVFGYAAYLLANLIRTRRAAR